MKIEQAKNSAFHYDPLFPYSAPAKEVKNFFSKTLKVKIKLTVETCPALYYIC